MPVELTAIGVTSGDGVAADTAVAMLIGVAIGVIAVCRLVAAELDSSDPPIQAIKLTNLALAADYYVMYA